MAVGITFDVKETIACFKLAKETQLLRRRGLDYGIVLRRAEAIAGPSDCDPL
jgi:hypothetical protein